MFQIIDGIKVFVVELIELPPLPVTDGGISEYTPYANALTQALYMRVITGPGKYGIEVNDQQYSVHRIIE
jgi:hypothetical protein